MRSASPKLQARIHRVILVALCAAALAGGCDRRDRARPGPSSVDLPDQEVGDFVVTETDQGRVQWRLFARSAAMYHARSLVVARGVRIDFYGEDGARSSTLTAREGELNEVQRDMLARGDVVLQTTEGTRMTTQSLRFLNRTQRIVSEDFVRVERRGDVLTGYGFESDPDLTRFEFKRQVQAVVRTRSGGLIEEKGKGR